MEVCCPSIQDRETPLMRWKCSRSAFGMDLGEQGGFMEASESATESDRQSVFSITERTLSRRELLKVAGLAAAGGFLASCTSGATPRVSPTAGATLAPKKGGTLRVGLGSGGTPGLPDPAVILDGSEHSWAINLYDQLGKPDAAFETIELQLAEEITPNATGNMWTVRLKDGIEFHNGKTLDADDLIFSFQRALDPEFGYSSAGPFLSFIDPKQMKKVDNRTVSFGFDQPYASFIEGVTVLPYMGLVPVGFDPKNAVGTGPFKLESFKSADRAVLVRNENYWGQVPYLDRLELIQINDVTARLNSLLSGESDAITDVPGVQARVIENTSGQKLLINKGGGQRIFSMRNDVAPFNDSRVAQAFKLIADRPALIELGLLGYGKVANDLPSPFDPCFASDIPQRAQNLDQARSLLKQAGFENLTVTLSVTPIASGLVEGAQAFAEQAKAAGVTVKIQNVDPASYYVPPAYPYVFGVGFWGTLNFMTRAFVSLLPTSAFNDSQFNDAEFTDLFNAAQRELDTERRCQLVNEAQHILWDRGSEMIWSFADNVDAHKEGIVGFDPSRAGLPLSAFQFQHVGYA
jgi:peptide/nickel transport system substrate-binding protein